MTTLTTPEQAKYIASHLLTHDATASLALRSLADQVESLTKERDEFNYSLVSTANRKLRSEVDVLRKERDALKDAARRALDALHAVLHDCDDIVMVESNEPGRDVGPWELSNDAITALRAVL